MQTLAVLISLACWVLTLFGLGGFVVDLMKGGRR
jgi:hypothetical protein